MYLARKCAPCSFILLALLIAFSPGIAHAVPVNFAPGPDQEVPVAKGAVLPPALVALPEANSLLVWREPDSGERNNLALLDTGTSAKHNQTLKPVLSWETGEKNSYVLPALEVPGFIVLLNLFDRVAFPDRVREGKKVYGTTPSTIWEHVRRQNWTFDKDSFEVNQFGHPYEGATMYGLARSSGLSFWQSLIYSHAGSFLWEMAGETTRPSFNDLVTTGNAGSLLGEALFRMASLVIEDGGYNPGWRHELAATVISPPMGFNRLAFGERFDTPFPSHEPGKLWRFMLGASQDTHASNLALSAYDADAIASFTMEYGLPGKPGYTYRRPMDYFDFQLSTRLRIGNILEAVMVRGLLLGRDYPMGDDYRGIWGLYGSYDYISPHLYRVSSTAVSLGTTGQYWIAPGVALQGSVLGGLGFGAAGTDTQAIDGRGYHYGVTPQALLALSVLFGDRTMLEVTGRGYYISDAIPDHTPGSEFVMRANAGITVRVVGNHAVGLHYVESLRDTNYDIQLNRHHSEGTLSVVYTFLSDARFGAVEWRDAAGR